MVNTHATTYFPCPILNHPITAEQSDEPATPINDLDLESLDTHFPQLSPSQENCIKVLNELDIIVTR